MSAKSFEEWKGDIDKSLPDGMYVSNDQSEGVYRKIRLSDESKLKKWVAGEKLGKGDFTTSIKVAISLETSRA